MLSVLSSFLTDREQTVCINGHQSRVIKPTSSVPQGSILSPLLFALFINELPTLFVCKVLLFADDVKLFQKIKSLQDCIKLQRDLATLGLWCTENKLNLNVSKCFFISFSRRRDIRTQTYDYKLNNTSLTQVSVIKDLGILFDSKLSFSNHINSIVTRAYKAIGFISRSLNNFKKVATYKNLYYSYV